jgi:hypothetical protein
MEPVQQDGVGIDDAIRELTGTAETGTHRR